MRRVPRPTAARRGSREVGAVGLRLVVVAVFIAAIAVPAVLAYDTGVLPGPAQASAGSSSVSTTNDTHRVAALVWPTDALGLTATDTAVLWEQRDPSAAVAGLWSYDVRTQSTERMLDRSVMGKSAGFPSASGDVITWAAWTGRRGVGTPHIEAYDTTSTRRWTVARAGREPSAAGESVLWVEGHAAGGDSIRGSNSLTDEEYSIAAAGKVHDIAAWGSWVAWIAGPGKTGAVWAGSCHNAKRFKLAAAGSIVAIDRDRVLWATAAGGHATALVSWDRHSRRSTVLCRVAGSVSSLALSSRQAVWVTTRDATGPQIWAYDFGADRAYAVSVAAGRQASPVIVADSVYWADDRSGHWELYARSLR